jgi:lipoyl-dependent peroxiredoxin
MSLADLLSERGNPPRELRTTARVVLEQQDAGFRLTRIDLQTVGDVPGVDAGTFVSLAEQAKITCPVSLALAGVEISLHASLTES